MRGGKRLRHGRSGVESETNQCKVKEIELVAGKRRFWIELYCD
jgi:hypothetical protein